MITPLPYFNYIRGLLAVLIALCNTTILVGNGNQPCEAYAAKQAGHAIWLSKYQKDKHANFFFDQQGGSLVENQDGTAHVYGTIINKKDAQDQWEVQLWLSDRMNWEQWSALGRKYKDSKNLSDGLHKTWSYYIMDPDKESKLIGKGNNQGKVIPLRHNPIDFTYGFQVGQAANDKNKNYGFSGWFLYFLNGDEPRQGDFNFDLSCSNTPEDDCPECYTSEILSQTKTEDGCTVYTLEVKNDGACKHGLSHYTVEIPCGEVSNISNSENWKVEIGKDPTTGINGFKIDDINDFGEAGQPGSFLVEFTVCPDADCGAQDCREVQVAHKAGQCITSEVLPLCYMSDSGQPGDHGEPGDGQADCDVNELAANINTNDVSCANAQDGSITIAIVGGTAPFTFEWSNGATTQDISALGGGNYTVTITDETGATLELSGTVFEPVLLTASGTVSPLGCGAANGSIVLDVSGGTAPYSYNWSNGSNEKDLSGLTAGDYQVTVTDTNGCTVSENFTLLATSDISATISSNQCNDGFLTLDIMGGVPPYSFNWSTGETTKDIKVTQAGTYEVIVTDVNGCSTTGSIDLGAPTVLDLTVQAIKPSCGGNSDGAINLSVTGGQAPYSYSWTLAGVEVASTEDLSNIASGAYQVTVTDANGCKNVLDYFLANPTSIFISEDVTLIRCDGNGADGAIEVNIFNAAAPYTTTWTRASVTGTFSTEEDLTGLSADVYTLTVQDANGCEAVKYIELAAPEDFQVDLATQYCGDGRICPTINGGNGPYNYQWTGPNGAITTIDGCIDASEAGDYTVVVMDANGCTKTATINIGTPNPSLTTSVEVNEPTCAGNGGSASVVISGGDGNYTILWSTGENTASISGLEAGTYTVKVTDGNDCQQFRAFSIQDVQGVIISGAELTQVSCNGETDGSVNITLMNGVAPYTYQWSNGAVSEDLSNVAAGNYTVVVTDANGCSAEKSYDLTVNPNNSNCDTGGGDGGTGGGDGGDNGGGDGNGDGTPSDCIRDCNECDGKINQLTLKYLGDETNAQITVKQKNGGQIVFDEIVDPNAEFSFVGMDTKGTLSSEIIITVNGGEATTIHTSCSQPIGPGLIAGSFEVMEGESRNGGPLCPIEPGTEQTEETTEEDNTEPQGEDCAECHDTQVISISETDAGCITYTLEVANNGACAQELSHFSIRVPCGIVTEASNSRGWKMELNSKDPTTNLYGLKVDDIHGFDEEGSFTVTYTVCPNQDETCITKLKSDDIIIGYKAAQCAKIETIKFNDQAANFEQPTQDMPLTFIRFSVYPNPVDAKGSNGLSLKFEEANIGEELNVKVVSMSGRNILTKRMEISRENEILSLPTAGLTPGIYYVTITSHHKVYSEKIIVK